MCPLLAVLAIVSRILVTGKALKPVEEALEGNEKLVYPQMHLTNCAHRLLWIMSQCEYANSPGYDESKELEECVEGKYMPGRGRKMSSLISQLLMLARAGCGKRKLRLETVNMKRADKSWWSKAECGY